ncbi:hypothetical protein K488DRAFT_44124 [Vararia minispora EC-137]|uniref:Uncharacterized protein n=1 Tax=Vararia minispora EC-137 TaxID=1314806 RepID=A0ACB8QTS2_9AGAM|nr:hypothetical protein K488DRAFT_44124 [Vararia minispora EC-137]
MTSASPTASSLTSYPTTPAFTDDLEWFTAYAVIHMLSSPSRRVTYIVWIVIGALVLIYAAWHALSPRGGPLRARWHKWALRRRTWRKQHSLAAANKNGQPHRQPVPLPSNAQLFCLAVIIIVTFCFMFVGPDYLAPSASLWHWERRRADSYTLDTFYPLQPQYTIGKAWWTSGGRAGLIAFALFPLCVLFALKAPPFALFANPWTINLHFDKLSWLHRWVGRLIWFVSAVHTALWSVELAKDKRANTGHIAYAYAWGYTKFVYAWIAFGFLTALIVFSLRPFRERFYETFYFAHVSCVIGVLVFSALHHPPVWWWCWAALLLWGGERLWRATRWFYTNGFIGSSRGEATVGPAHDKLLLHPTAAEAGTPSPLTRVTPSKSPYGHSPASSSRHFLFPPPSAANAYIPPTGYAHIELLAGRTVRLTLSTPGYVSWAPGQHFLVTVPCISRFLSHPFTCASLCDEQILGPEGRTLVFYIRAKQGWTRDLWDGVVGLLSARRKYPAGEHHPPNVLPSTGVLMRAWVDGPFGSCTRNNWGQYSTAVLVAGGSGVSFTLAVMEYVALCMVGRNGRFLGVRGGSRGFKTDRIRFVWIVREFSHLQWGATVIRRCLSLLPRSQVQVDIFVTNAAQMANIPRAWASTDKLVPPTPAFAAEGGVRTPTSPLSAASRSRQLGDEPQEEYVDLSYYTGEFTDPHGLGHEEHVLDYTNFDGDDDESLPGETSLSNSIRKEGKIRREKSRRITALFETAKKDGSGTVYPPDNRAARASSATLLGADYVPPSRRAPLKLETRLEALDEDSVIEYPREPSPHPSPLGLKRASSIFSDAPSTDLEGELAESRSAPQMYDPGAHTRSHSNASSVLSLMPRTGHGAHGQTVQLELDDNEMGDMRFMAEFTLPGKPRLEMILRDEVSRASGPLVVACCGPIGLNAIVRKVVAAQIDPGKIARGDTTGYITLVTEDFDY